MSECYKRIKKIIFWHIDTTFTVSHIVLAAFSPGQRLVWAMCLCRGLGQAWRFLAAKGIAVALRRERVDNNEQQFEELK